MTYQWDFSQVFRNMDLLLSGLWGTGVLMAWSLVVAVPLGLLLAVMRMSRIPVIPHLAGIYVEFFRSAPAIVLIYWFFFSLPILIGLNFPPLTAAVLAVGLQAAAFLCEVFRSGIVAVPQGQWEASAALGMTRQSQFFSIVLPQAIRHMVPVFLIRIIDLLKNTTLASVIAYTEVVYTASQVASRTFRPIETFTILGGVFFVIIFCISRVARWYERRLGMRAG